MRGSGWVGKRHVCGQQARAMFLITKMLNEGSSGDMYENKWFCWKAPRSFLGQIVVSTNFDHQAQYIALRRAADYVLGGAKSNAIRAHYTRIDTGHSPLSLWFRRICWAYRNGYSGCFCGYPGRLRSLTRQVDDLCYTLNSAVHDVAVLKSVLERRDFWMPRFTSGCGLNGCCTTTAGAGATPWKALKRYPDTLEEEDFLREALNSAEQEVQQFKKDVEIAQTLT